MTPGRWAWAEIDLDAVAHNVRYMRARVAPAAVWAVVKANGYGHGAVDVARAAMAAGAEGLCVALVDEGVELRAAGLDAPILVLSEQPLDQARRMVDHRLTPTVYSGPAIDAFAACGTGGYPLHLKIDTGMNRVGARPAEAVELVEQICARSPAVRLAGVFTHLAVADDPSNPFTTEQLERFDSTLADVGGIAGHVALTHAANSAGGLASQHARRSLVRAGIALYGISPGAGVDHLVRPSPDDGTGLRPAMSLRARVSHVKRVCAGERCSYGLRHTFATDTGVATLPVGYADGVPRRLGTTGGEVLIGGRRRPIVGVVTMDQILVDVGDDDVARGDEAVLIGEQAGERIRAEDWADRLGTIGYEIVCGIANRIPRVVRP